MKNLFERTSSNWVRYSEYEWRAAEDGTLYLTPTKTAQPSIYDPLAEYQKIVLDAINIGRMGMSKKPDAEIQKAIQQFAVKYGFSSHEAFTRAFKAAYGVTPAAYRETLWNMRRCTCRKITSSKKKLCPLKNIWHCSFHLTNWM